MTEGQGQAEKVLLVLQGRQPSDHPGIVDGYARLRASGVVDSLEIMPVFGPDGVSRGAAFWREFNERVMGGVTLVVFQYYHSRALPDPRPAIRRIRTLPAAPFIVSTLGDPFMNGYLGRPNVPPSFLMTAELSDLVTLTSMGTMADYVSRFTRAPIILSPNAACQVRFRSEVNPPPMRMPEFDVLFIGSRNSGRNPLRPNTRFGRQRDALVTAMERRFGKRFAVFGNGWEGRSSNQGPVPFDQQAATARRARVVVGGVPFSRARYYTSNRPFIQMTSAVPFVDTAVEGVETLLRPGEHWVLSSDRDLVRAIEGVLEMEQAKRSAMGHAAARYIAERHTQAHRVSTLLENVRRLRRSRATNSAQAPYMPFLLDDVDLVREMLLATRNWPMPGSSKAAWV